MDQKVKRLVEAVEEHLNNLDSAGDTTGEWLLQDIAEIREAVIEIRKEQKKTEEIMTGWFNHGWESEQEPKYKTFTILWPLPEEEKERVVSAASIENRYRDAVSNGQIEETTSLRHGASPARMAKALHEAGLITLKREGS